MASYKTVVVKEVENRYQTSETVNGGYLNRGACAYYTYIITWDKNYRMIKFLFDDKDLTDLALFGVDESSELYKYRKFEYGKMKVAIPRHLKALKIFTGDLAKPEEKKSIKLIYQRGYHENLSIGEVTNVSDKRLTIGSYYTGDFKAVDCTPEMEEIAIEFIKKYNEFQKYRSGVMLKLFNNKKYNKLK